MDMNTNKIISFSLWGNNPKYTIGAIRNAELAKIIYPDWMCKFFVGSDTPVNIIDTLGAAGLVGEAPVPYPFNDRSVFSPPQYNST